MREIKFRAWDGKRLSEPFSFENICEPMGMRGKFVCDLIGKENKRYYFNIKKCKFIQFTGLKDKNGKEIFEGHIIEFQSAGGKKRMEADMFNIRESNFYESYLWICEVIGNKFENPELLEE